MTDTRPESRQVAVRNGREQAVVASQSLGAEEMVGLVERGHALGGGVAFARAGEGEAIGVEAGGELAVSGSDLVAGAGGGDSEERAGRFASQRPGESAAVIDR